MSPAQTQNFSWPELTPYLQPGRRAYIMAHQRPDGDACGTALGLAVLLRSLGLEACYLRPHQPRIYTWLPGQELIRTVEPEKFLPKEEDLLFVVDCGDAERCEYPLKQKPVLNLDHHISNPLFGRLNWLDVKAGAAAEVLCRILMQGNIPIPPDAATCFLTAILTDTGWFKFSSAGAKTLAVASHLVECGADFSLIRRELWENRPFVELMLLQEIAARFELFSNNQGAICCLSYELLREKGIMDAETDSVMDMIRCIQGIEVTALLKETAPGTIKVSLRSKYRLNCSELAATFGGGGHIRAAGCTIFGSLTHGKAAVLRLLQAALQDPA